MDHGDEKQEGQYGQFPFPSLGLEMRGDVEFKSFSFLGRKIGKWLFMFKLRVSCLLFVCKTGEDKVSFTRSQHKALPGYLPSHFISLFSFYYWIIFILHQDVFFSPPFFHHHFFMTMCFTIGVEWKRLLGSL